MKLPSMDAVASVLKQMGEQELEQIKTQMIKTLLTKKVLHKFCFSGKFLIAIDATGIATYKEKHCEDCLYSESKNGKKTYYHKVLEAKIVTANGFSISLATEWIDNENIQYNKQGCEMKSFRKLAEKIKGDFPRLPICLLADGLYPNNTFFNICKSNNWDYIVTLKEGNLKLFWEKIRLINRQCRVFNTKGKQQSLLHQKVQWINNMEHNGFSHNWIRCDEQKASLAGEIKNKRFVYLTNMSIAYENSIDIIKHGRLRWKIENEGFNSQKNHGYNIQHKFCRKSYLGLKNFYQCCQIGDIINQLVTLSEGFKTMLNPKESILFIWELTKGYLIYCNVDAAKNSQIKEKRYLIQYRE